MSDEEPARAPVRTWRSRVPAPLRRGAAILLTLLVIEYLVIPKFVAAKDSVSLVVHANIVLFLVALVLEAVSLFTYALLTRVLLPPDARGWDAIPRRPGGDGGRSRHSWGQCGLGRAWLSALHKTRH